MGKKTKDVLPEAAEFQPDAIELENHQPPISVHFVWYIIILALLFLLGWASLTEVDKVVTAEGKITTIRPPITMKPLDRTTIRKVHVKVGQRVQKDDILFTFDQTVNQQELSRLKDQLSSYKAEKLRLLAELDGYRADPKMSTVKNSYEQRQLQVYLKRKQYFEMKNKSYNETIRRYERTLKAQADTLKHYQERQKALEQIEKMYLNLHSRNAVSLKELLSTQVEVIGTAIQLENQQLSMLENRQVLAATIAERDAFVADWFKQIGENVVSTERSIISYEREIPKYEMYVSMTEMRAPCNSVVHELAPFQEGSAVREAEALVTLIPTDTENLIAEVNIPANDISLVKRRDKCKLKLDAFPFQQYGTLKGEIFYISQDAFKGEGAPVRNDDGGMQSASAQGVTYQARLRISGNFTGSARKSSLLPGMRLKAEIVVGRRRILTYIFNPFLKAIDEAIREP
jgi:HlyD family secretion protein